MELPEPEYGTDGGFVWITFRRPNSDTNSVTNLDRIYGNVALDVALNVLENVLDSTIM